MPTVRISITTRDALYWLSALSVIFAVFLAMAGIAQVPPSLEELSMYEVQPIKILQQTTRLKKSAARGGSIRYALVGLSQGQQIYFGFPDNPVVLERLQRITLDNGISTRVKLWVEKNDFAEVFQATQGDRMIWSFGESAVKRRENAYERFRQALMVLAISGITFLVTRKLQVT